MHASLNHYHCHDDSHAHALEGRRLASFWQRVAGYLVDMLISVILWAPLEGGWRYFVRHEQRVEMNWDFHEPGNILILLLYLGLANYFGNGQTPGKWVARTRAVSLVSARMGLWQSLERALGYGAAVLEGGVGFLQFFWSANRQCAQDRLAETVVLDIRTPKA